MKSQLYPIKNEKFPHRPPMGKIFVFCRIGSKNVDTHHESFSMKKQVIKELSPKSLWQTYMKWTVGCHYWDVFFNYMFYVSSIDCCETSKLVRITSRVQFLLSDQIMVLGFVRLGRKMSEKVTCSLCWCVYIILITVANNVVPDQ